MFGSRIVRPFAARALVLVAAFALAACSDDEDAADSADSGDQPEVVDVAEDDAAATEDAEDKDAGPLPCPAPAAAPGVSRARTLKCKEELPTGGMAGARVGDYVLENAMARFVVRAGPAGEAVVGLVGGNVVDAVRLGPDGKQLGVDSLREWVPIVAMFLVSPDKIEALSEDDGKTGVVRVSGKLVPFPTVHAFLSLEAPEAEVFNEYRLRADSTALEVRTVIKPTAGKLTTVLVGDAVFLGGSVGLYRPTSGAPDSGLQAPAKTNLIGIAPMRADPGLIPGAIGFAGTVSTLDAGGILAFIQPNAPVPEAGRTVVRRLVVGGDGGASLAAAMATASANPGGHGVVSGKVVGMQPGVKVELLDAKDRPLTRCTPDQAGAFKCPAPLAAAAARAIRVGNGEGQVGGRGQHGPKATAKVMPKGGGAPPKLELEAPALAKLHITVKSAAGAGIPFQARLIPQAKIASYGQRVFIDGDGDATFLLPSGAWKVWLHHGPEWSAHSETITISAAKTGEINATLSHVVDTTGWIAADTHIHAEHSADSEVPNRERILDAIAVGLDYAVATDHDYVTDYQPWLKAAGVSAKITVASGVEVSTAALGHHCLWPVAIDKDKSGNGAPNWHGKDAAQLMSLLGQDDKQVHQLNHARGSQSYFVGISFDPGKTEDKLLTFDAIELINGKRIDDTEEVIGDWFGLLDRGLRPSATGTSDSHVLDSGVGSARTWVRLGKAKDGKGRDRQGKFTAAQADAAILAGHTVASTGPLMVLELMAGEVTRTVGETLKGAKGQVTARVTVKAPEWMPLGKVSIFRNAAEVHVADISKAPVKDGARVVTVQVSAPAAIKPGWWSAVLRPIPGTARPPIQWREVWAVSSPVSEAP